MISYINQTTTTHKHTHNFEPMSLVQVSSYVQCIN